MIRIRPAALYRDLRRDWGIMRCFRVYLKREEQAVTARSCHCHASDLSRFRKSANIRRYKALGALWVWHPHTFYGQACQLDAAFTRDFTAHIVCLLHANDTLSQHGWASSPTLIFLISVRKFAAF